MRPSAPLRLTLRDLIALPYIALCLSFIRFRPLWDGMQYWRCTVEAAAYPFNPFRYDCFHHPTMGFMLPVGLSQRFTGPNYPAVLVVSVAIGTLGVLAFSRILDHLVPGDAWRVERLLGTLLMSLFPIYTACTIQLTPDFGMAVYALCLVLSLLENRLRWAVFFGALTVLCKETGLALYLSITCSWLVYYVLRDGSSELPPLQRLKARASLLIVPFIPVIDSLGRRNIPSTQGLWHGHGSGTALWRQLMSVSFLDDLLPTQLWELTGINFLWTMSLFIVLDSLQQLARALWNWACDVRPVAPTDDSRAARFVSLAFVGTAFALTRYRTYAMPRYVLPGIPILLLVGIRSFWNLEVAPRPRRLMLAVIAVMFTISNFVTRDGVSIKLFDVMRFGRRPILDLTANTHECCRTDQLVYNLEFAQLDYLLAEALPVLFAHGVVPLGFPRFTADNMVSRVQRHGFRRTTQRDDNIEVTSVALDAQGQPWPLVPTLWYLELPQLDEDELILWRNRYTFGPPRTFSRFGYQIKAIPMQLRPEFTPHIVAPPTPAH